MTPWQEFKMLMAGTHPDYIRPLPWFWELSVAESFYSFLLGWFVLFWGPLFLLVYVIYYLLCHVTLIFSIPVVGWMKKKTKISSLQEFKIYLFPLMVNDKELEQVMKIPLKLKSVLGAKFIMTILFALGSSYLILYSFGVSELRFDYLFFGALPYLILEGYMATILVYSHFMKINIKQTA